MPWSKHIVFSLCYAHQRLLSEAQLALSPDLATLLPEVSDPLKDLDKNIVFLFTHENLDENQNRLKSLELAVIQEDDGAVVTKIKALLNILLSAARFLEHTTPQQVSDLLQLIAAFHFKNTEKAVKRGASFRNILKVVKSKSNIEILREIKKLWEGVDREYGLNTLLTIRENWRYLSGDDFADLHGELDRTWQTLKLLTIPLLPLVAALEEALNLQLGTLTELLPFYSQNETFDEENNVAHDEFENAPIETKIYKGVSILRKIECEQWFTKNEKQMTASGLKKVQLKLDKLHKEGVNLLKNNFKANVSDCYIADSKGFFPVYPTDTPATVELKNILNCLHECSMILSQIDNAAFPTLEAITCIMRFNKLFQQIKELGIKQVIEYYVERINTTLRELIRGFNPILQQLLCEIERIEIDLCLRPGVIGEMISLKLILDTYIHMTVELGADIQDLPPFIQHMEVIYAYYHKRFTDDITRYAESASKFKAIEDLLTGDKNKYLPLLHFDNNHIELIQTTLAEAPIADNLKEEYQREISRLMNPSSQEAVDKLVKQTLQEIDFDSEDTHEESTSSQEDNEQTPPPKRHKYKTAIREKFSKNGKQSKPLKSDKKGRKEKKLSKRQSKKKYELVPSHNNLDEFFSLYAEKFLQLKKLREQQIGQINLRKAHARQAQARLIKDGTHVRERIYQRQDVLDQLNAERKALLNLRDHLDIFINDLNDNHQSFPEGVISLENIISKTITLKNAHDMCVDARKLLTTKVFKNGYLFKPKKRSDETHQFYVDSLNMLTGFEINQKPYRNHSVPETYEEIFHYDVKLAKQDSPHIPIKLRIQAVAIYFYAALLKESHAYCDDDYRLHLVALNTFFEENVLTEKLSHFSKHPDQNLLTESVTLLERTPYTEADDDVTKNHKAILNTLATTAWFIQSIDQVRVDAMLLALDEATKAAKNEHASDFRKGKKAAKEGSLAAVMLAAELDNGWRPLLLNMSTDLLEFNSQSFDIVAENTKLFIESTQLQRQELKTKAYAFLRAAHVKTSLLDEWLSNAHAIKENGVHIPQKPIIKPASDFIMWGTKKLGQMEMGTTAEHDQIEPWADEKLSQEIHQIFHNLHKLMKKVSVKIFENEIANPLQEDLPFDIRQDIPAPLRELFIYLNIAYHADLLIKHINKNQLMVSRLLGSQQHKKAIKNLTKESQFEDVIKDFVVRLNSFCRDCFPLMDIIFSLANKFFDEIETKLHLREGVLREKIQFQRLELAFANVKSLFQNNPEEVNQWLNSFNQLQ